ncbi:MAG: hypothetical protein K8S54_02760 [Spirochaetia bacterium]|nr:hypothetical protein [Spirochaetia bacterium]
MALGRLLGRAAAGSLTIVELPENIRKLQEWREIFQAFGFRVFRTERNAGRARVYLNKSVPSVQSRKWSIILPRYRVENTFERLFQWIAFFQRFDAIVDAEIILIEDIPLVGNDSMLKNIATEGFFLRKKHFESFGLSKAIATGIHFSAGRRVLVDCDSSVPVDEIQALLETTFRLDTRLDNFVVTGIPWASGTNLRKKPGRIRRILRKLFWVSWKERMRFTLMPGETAQALLPMFQAGPGFFRPGLVRRGIALHETSVRSMKSQL